jgi:hypothetical protein
VSSALSEAKGRRRIPCLRRCHPPPPSPVPSQQKDCYPSRNLATTAESLLSRQKICQHIKKVAIPAEKLLSQQDFCYPSKKSASTSKKLLSQQKSCYHSRISAIPAENLLTQQKSCYPSKKSANPAEILLPQQNPREDGAGSPTVNPWSKRIHVLPLHLLESSNSRVHGSHESHELWLSCIHAFTSQPGWDQSRSMDRDHLRSLACKRLKGQYDRHNLANLLDPWFRFQISSGDLASIDSRFHDLLP